MSDCDDQLRHVSQWNHRLCRENSLLRIKVHSMEREIRALEADNARLGVEAEAAESLLKSAMDAALEVKRP
jgi:hypothetical protein